MAVNNSKGGIDIFSVRLWICLLAIIALAGSVLYLRGVELWIVLLICLALVCPAVLLWGLALLRAGAASVEKESLKPED